MFFPRIFILSSVLAFIAAGNMVAETGMQNWKLIYEDNFEDGDLTEWGATDPDAWRLEKARGGSVLALYGQSDYEAEVRSPFNINLVRNVETASFVMELRVLSTTEDYPHRDVCFFFGHQDPTHFYYVHIANNADEHANSIFVVDGEPRVSIAEERTAGTRWDSGWHTVRIVREAGSGLIEVYFDDLTNPIMTAHDTRFGSGRLGVGSFDDTASFDDIRIWSLE